MTKETPHPRILDRDASKQLVAEHFKDEMELFREVIDYGTNLLLQCFKASGRKIPDVVILGAFVKQAIAMGDATEALVSQGASYAASVAARGLIEAYFQLAWLLDRDTDRRAKQYYVWDVRRQRYWSRAVIPGTDEHTTIMGPLRGFSRTGHDSSDFDMVKTAKDNLAQIERILARGEYKAINSEFDELYIKRGYDPPWYQLRGGVSSFRKMAAELDQESLYNVFYKSLSTAAHAQALRRHVSFAGDHIVFEPIRHLEGIDMVIKITISLLWRVYLLIIDRYTPGERTNFLKRYVEHWRKKFWAVKGVKYESGNERAE